MTPDKRLQLLLYTCAVKTRVDELSMNWSSCTPLSFGELRAYSIALAVITDRPAKELREEAELRAKTIFADRSTNIDRWRREVEIYKSLVEQYQ